MKLSIIFATSSIIGSAFGLSFVPGTEPGSSCCLPCPEGLICTAICNPGIRDIGGKCLEVGEKCCIQPIFTSMSVSCCEAIHCSGTVTIDGETSQAICTENSESSKSSKSSKSSYNNSSKKSEKSPKKSKSLHYKSSKKSKSTHYKSSKKSKSTHYKSSKKSKSSHYVPKPKPNDICFDPKEYKYRKNNCNKECKQCRVQKVYDDNTCDLACPDLPELSDSTCDTYSYDNPDYCRHKKPKECEDKSGFEVSVCGDATYKIKTVDQSEICSGDGDEPNGFLCPSKDDIPISDCREETWSYDYVVKTGSKNGEKCRAPQDAKCMKLASTGVWGCVFPNNCNSKRACLEKNYCPEGKTCTETESGYVKMDKNDTDYQDMDIFAEPISYATYNSLTGSGSVGLTAFDTLSSIIILLISSYVALLH